MTSQIKEGASSDYGQNFSAAYVELTQKEKALGNPQEVIFIPGLSTTSQEFVHLKNSGVSQEELIEGRIPRGKLLEAGYVFVNRVARGEKPIINAKIPLTGRGQNLNLKPRILLTQDELDAVLNYQSQHPEKFGAGGNNVDVLRQDMLIFLEECLAEAKNLRQKSIDAFKATQGRILESEKYLDVDRQTLRKFFTELGNKPRAGMELLFIMESCMQGIDLARVRGLPVEVYNSRLAALHDAPSPFLDSGFHFGQNLDVTVFPNDHTKIRRLNMVVVHLLSRGLNEMGASLNASHDQTYVTSQEYVNEILSAQAKPDQNNGKIPEEILDLIAIRLLARAKMSL